MLSVRMWHYKIISDWVQIQGTSRLNLDANIINRNCAVNPKPLCQMCYLWQQTWNIQQQFEILPCSSSLIRQSQILSVFPLVDQPWNNQSVLFKNDICLWRIVVSQWNQWICYYHRLQSIYVVLPAVINFGQEVLSRLSCQCVRIVHCVQVYNNSVPL